VRVPCSSLLRRLVNYDRKKFNTIGRSNDLDSNDLGNKIGEDFEVRVTTQNTFFFVSDVLAKIS
jgi:hypothetical protein